MKRLAAAAAKGRWLALRAIGTEEGGRLPGNSTVTVTVGPGTPSAEGPRTTTAAEAFSFRTYGPLRVTGFECGYEKRCSPFDQWRIEFTNPLDAESLDGARVKVEPEVPGLTANAYGNYLYIGGTKRGRTTYKVTLDPGIRDQFGQTLGQSAPMTFNVGPAPPSLMAAGGNFVVLDPAGGPQLSVFSVNQPWVKVSLYAVGPEDFGRYVSYMRFLSGYYEDVKRKQTTPPGTLVSARTVAIKGQPDEMTETRLDLSPALKGRTSGNVFVVVEPGARTPRGAEREILRTWAQLTSIGLDAFADGQELVGWATSLADGRPLEGVEMTLQPSGTRAVSDREGLARMPLPGEVAARTAMLVARKGDETAFMPERSDWWSDESAWFNHASSDELRWYVFDDRKMYRPGEEVSIKGWLRRVGGGKGGDVGALAGATPSVSYVVRDSRGNEVGKGSARVNALGGFDTKFKLPPTMNLGNANVQFVADGGAGLSNVQYGHGFQVQEFRRPEFEVTARAEEGPHFVGGH
ncbi:MAG TPA: MG2 domain-containing protein, partial [Pyrinomonadaceae bacterium]|nr:MG2 domain-containing protein [Pyrinomonadaceae bacterium]